MPRPGADRALRRLIAELALRPSDDVAAVLEKLAPAERQRAERLLAEFHGRTPSAAAPAAPETAREVEVGLLSPWLRARLEAKDNGGATADFKVTPRALQALRAAADSLDRRAHAVGRPARRSGSGLFDLASQWLEGRKP